MTDFNSAFLQIKSLVDTFKQDESKFLAQSYSEMEVRNDFINKFFIALGWDVRHKDQTNPYEQEVKVEKPLRIGDRQRWADYAFFLAPNYKEVKFFVEAKKPAKNLFNADYYFQTCSYGWNAKTPIAVLTDFEEFHILDCRTRPDIGNILDNQIAYFHYTDYADKEKFSKIYWLFSREAVADGSIEKYTESLPNIRGKAKKGLYKAVQPVDESFLEELDEIRLSLAKAFKNNNPELDSDELTEMTQRTIDRLVFIRFLEDKQIEPDDYVSKFAASKKSWDDFVSASRMFDAKYNGIVFKKHRIDTKNFLEPDDKTFSSICAKLSHNNAPYNFDLIPIHILGSIYERFLGNIVVSTDKRARIEEKPEVRKAGGVYYTPQYIVNYIVDNTVGKLIDGKTPKEISKMRFADISCGSGSFLITVFDRLLDYHKKWYQQNPRQAEKDGCHKFEGRWILSLKQKQSILTNNIFGVDIDHQAVEVTQLSLYLKLLEDETTATAHETWVMFKEQLLPSLNKNIICGNSLIGTGIFEGSLFEYEEEKKLKPMNFKDAFPEIMKNGGFDAIVGNPPYKILGKEETVNEVAVYLKAKYFSFQYKADLYHLFIEKAIKLLKSDGKMGYITPNTWYTLQFTKNLREFVLEKSNLEELLIFNHKVFNAANVDTSITILNKTSLSKRNNNVKVKVFDKNFTSDKIYKTLPEIFNLDNWKRDELKRFEVRTSVETEKLLKKIRENSFDLGILARASLGTQAYNSIKHTQEQIKNRVFHSNKKLSNEYMPELSGNDVGRFILQWQKKEYIKYGPWLHDYRTMEWLTGPRILVREIIAKGYYKIYATYVEDTYCNYKTILNIIYGEDKSYSMKYLLGVLNSRFISYIFPLVSNKIVKENFPRISVRDLRLLPIHKINFNKAKEKSLHDRIVHLVDQMLETKRKLHESKTESEKEYLETKCNSIDRQIDTLVYELYGLTDNEIKIVEGNS